MNSAHEKETAKQHIIKIASRYEADISLLSTIVNLSETVIQTALSGQNKFLFEILQNADDSPNCVNDSIKIEFIVNNDYLLIGHSGRGFDHNDVERICDFASHIKNAKSDDMEKTGYKGIGFKTLFNLADCVYVVSNGYSFRFDKNHWEQHKVIPWQIIPIWCEESLPILKQYELNYSVIFILKINKSNEIVNELRELLENSDVLLFLHHIDKLEVTIEDSKSILERIKKQSINEGFNEVSFFKNNTLKSEWLLKDYNHDVPTRLKSIMSNASQFIYPDKIKFANTISCTFAIQIKEQTLSKIRGCVFSTLPTQLKLGLAYHTNSSFILNLDRSQLHENEWNDFLLKSYGYSQLQFLHDLTFIPKLRNKVAILFKNSIYHHYNRFRQAFESGFNFAKEEITWLPAFKSSYLLKLTNAWVDTISFFEEFPLNDSAVLPYLVDHNVRSSQMLCGKYLAREFDLDCLLKKFSYYYHSNFFNTTYKNFLSFLYEKTRYPNNDQLNLMKNKQFLVTQAGKLVSPEKALLESTEHKVLAILEIDPIDEKFLSNELKDWLLRLGAKHINPNEIFIKILEWIPLGKINHNNHLLIIEYMAEALKSDLKPLRPEEIKILEKFPILTKSNSLRKASECYWHDEKLTEKLTDAIKNVISNDDLVNAEKYSPSVRKISHLMGIKNELNFETLYAKHMKHLSNPANWNYFWENMIKYWIVNEGAQNYDKLLSNVKNHFRSNACLVGNDELLHTSTEIYANIFKNMNEIDPERFPLLKSTSRLPASLEKWLGFKDKLEIKDILTLFQLMKKNPQTAIPSIFKILLKQFKLLKFDYKKIPDKSLIVLFAEDNTLQPASNLYFFEKDGDDFPRKSVDYLKKLDLMSHEEMLKLSSFCGVNIIPFDIEFKYKSSVTDTSLKKFYLQKLPFITLQEAHYLNQDTNIVLEKLHSQILEIELYQCSELTIKYPFQKQENPVKFYSNRLKFYVDGLWSNKRLKFKIHDQLAKEIPIKADIRETMEIDGQQDIDSWLEDNKFKSDDLKMLEEEILKLQNNVNSNSSGAQFELSQTENNLIQNTSSQEISMDEKNINIIDRVEGNSSSGLKTRELLNLSSSSQVFETDVSPLERNSNEYLKYQNQNDSMKYCVTTLNSDEDLVSQSELSQTENNLIQNTSSQEILMDEKNINTYERAEENSSRGLQTRELLNLSSSSKALEIRVSPLERNNNEYLNYQNQNDLMNYCVTILNSNENMESCLADTNNKISPEINIDEGSFDKRAIMIKENNVLDFAFQHFSTSPERNRNTGRRGEEQVYNYLKTSTENSKTEVIWLNKTNESGKPYDIILVENDEIKEFVEVKSTITANKRQFELSHQELLFLMKHRDKYVIYRVFNSLEARFEKLENPANLLEKGLLKITPIQYRVEYQPRFVALE